VYKIIRLTKEEARGTDTGKVDSDESRVALIWLPL
jgi:hypothetical protein